MVHAGVDREAEARAIAERAKQARAPTPRSLWVAAIAVAIVCVGALALGYAIGGAGTAADHRQPPRAVSDGVGGFGIGFVIGVGAGIAIGTAIAYRKRARK